MAPNANSTIARRAHGRVLSVDTHRSGFELIPEGDGTTPIIIATLADDLGQVIEVETKPGDSWDDAPETGRIALSVGGTSTVAFVGEAAEALTGHSTQEAFDEALLPVSGGGRDWVKSVWPEIGGRLVCAPCSDGKDEIDVHFVATGKSSWREPITVDAIARSDVDRHDLLEPVTTVEFDQVQERLREEVGEYEFHLVPMRGTLEAVKWFVPGGEDGHIRGGDGEWRVEVNAMGNQDNRHRGSA